ncbi:hypothetical protein HOS33_gp326 [Erwinia phage vB_EamM_Y3]|uniref:Uncharacterized protein n=1 Tax=Erwinia phage vB_EamM_Y3 TaxID=1983553 RepID=A0A2H4IBN4_9CAUD|nr:hypothetical protein HOS33_gp326 [Erwinia phage vB_EamM_Y3]ARW58966.1 hypothetical protein Y3_326 [Erwinia phage vB_EamM_Y3]
MAQKLSEQINRYFNLMESIRKQLFRVMPISNRYLCIVSFSTQYQAVMSDLVSKESLLPVKLLDGLTGSELVAYGTIMQAIEQWVASGMQEDFPLDQRQDVYSEYRRLTTDAEQESTEPQVAVVRADTHTRAAILRMSFASLVEAASDLGICHDVQTKDLKHKDLQAAVLKHLGMAQPDAEERDAQDIDNIKTTILSATDDELRVMCAEAHVVARKELRLVGRDEMISLMFIHHDIEEEDDDCGCGELSCICHAR